MSKVSAYSVSGTRLIHVSACTLNTTSKINVCLINSFFQNNNCMIWISAANLYSRIYTSAFSQNMLLLE